MVSGCLVARCCFTRLPRPTIQRLHGLAATGFTRCQKFLQPPHSVGQAADGRYASYCKHSQLHAFHPVAIAVLAVMRLLCLRVLSRSSKLPELRAQTLATHAGDLRTKAARATSSKPSHPCRRFAYPSHAKWFCLMLVSSVAQPLLAPTTSRVSRHRLH